MTSATSGTLDDTNKAVIATPGDPCYESAPARSLHHPSLNPTSISVMHQRATHTAAWGA